MHQTRRIPIVELNEYLTCKLCRGYFIDATTIIECLHTFCRTCIVRYLEKNKYCPICDVQVHKTKPLLNIRPDKTLQDIVYKLVPRLFQNEMCRRREFYAAHTEARPSNLEQCGEASYQHILSPDETICLSLNYHGSTSPPRYLRCPAAVSVVHLQKLLRSKYDLSDQYRVDILHNQDCLNSHLTLIDIAYIYLWRRKGPLELTYRIYENVKKVQEDPPTSTPAESETQSDKDALQTKENEWKEVQLRISENGEMCVTGVDDFDVLKESLAKCPVKQESDEEKKNVSPALQSREKDSCSQKNSANVGEGEDKSGKHKLESDGEDEPVAKQPKPTILNHTLGIHNLSNNHPLKRHSQIRKSVEVKTSTSNSTCTTTSTSSKVQSMSNAVQKNALSHCVPNSVQSSTPNVCSSAPSAVQSAPSTVQKAVDTLNLVQSVCTPVSSTLDAVQITTVVETTNNTTPTAAVPSGITLKTICSTQNAAKTALTPNAPKTVVSSPNSLKTITTSSLTKTAPASSIKTLSTPTPSKSSEASISKTPTATTTIPSASTYKPPQKWAPPTTLPCYAPKTTYNPVINVPKVQPSKPPVSVIPTSTASTTPSVQPTHSKMTVKKSSSPIGYKTLRDPPKTWNPQISRASLLKSPDPRYDKNVKPAKFFKMRNNLPRYLGNPASGVKPMYQVHTSPEKEKPETNKPDKIEIKKHSIVKIDPKTLKPISEKAPEISTLCNHADLKINTSSVPIFNPLKLQSSPKSDRKSPKSPQSPKKSPPSKRDKLNLSYTPPNPFIPNLTSPTLSPNQFLYPPGPPGFPAYDPRLMAAYHSLLYGQRMPYPALPGISMDLNQRKFDLAAPTSPKVPALRLAESSKSETHSSLKILNSLANKTKKVKETKGDKSLQNAVEKLTQNRVKELSKSEEKSETRVENHEKSSGAKESKKHDSSNQKEVSEKVENHTTDKVQEKTKINNNTDVSLVADAKK